MVSPHYLLISTPYNYEGVMRRYRRRSLQIPGRDRLMICLYRDELRVYSPQKTDRLKIESARFAANYKQTMLWFKVGIYFVTVWRQFNVYGVCGHVHCGAGFQVVVPNSYFGKNCCSIDLCICKITYNYHLFAVSKWWDCNEAPAFPKGWRNFPLKSSRGGE